MTGGESIDAAFAVVAGLVGLLTGFEGFRELLRLVVASSIWAFPIGAAFSGLLALTARGRSFDQLSLPRFAALGAGGGLLLFGVLAANAWDAWSLATAIANATIFVGLGGGSATAALMVARKTRPALKSGEDSRSLEAG